MLEIFSINDRKKVICQGARRSDFEKTGEGLRSLEAERECELTKDNKWLEKYLQMSCCNSDNGFIMDLKCTTV